MAERRMFSKTIIDSDMFLDMPATAQLLYFHLSMRADDDGFINKPKSIMRMCGAKDDDMKLLIAKKYIIFFESGIVAVRHWKVHNYIRKDTYKETMCEKEKSMLTADKNGMYHLHSENDMDTLKIRDEPVTDSLQNSDVPLTQDRKGKSKVSTGKENILLSADTDPNPQADYKNIMDSFNSVCVSLPKINNLTDLRKQKIRNAVKQLDGDFESFFRRIEESDFLTGRNGSWNGCCFDWVMKPSNLIKIMEGNYDNKPQHRKASFSKEPVVTYDLEAYEKISDIIFDQEL